MLNNNVRSALMRHGWFLEPGAYVMVDGQYGSTGKGLMAGVLAEYGENLITMVTTNAGPNSGHTYVKEDGGNIVTTQLPIASALLGDNVKTVINGGALVNPGKLGGELSLYMSGAKPIWLHENAAVISDSLSANFNPGSADAIASTGKGTGPAIAGKALRMPVTAKYLDAPIAGAQIVSLPPLGMFCRDEVVFVETAQGFSLGDINGFYPYVTSRECTVSRAIADAGIPPSAVRKTMMTVRTLPIRVGNTSLGNSGPCYPDQREMTWEEVGKEPETTTVTGRQRRIFTWSRDQFIDAVAANAPDAVFLNFCNYIGRADAQELAAHIRADYREVMGEALPLLLTGWGPKASDVEVWN